MKLIAYSLMTLMTLGSISLFGQDKYGSTPDEQLKCKEALSIYRSFRDQKQENQAYKTWQTACLDCPPNVSERMYSDGAKFIKQQYKASTDSKRKAVLLDSLFLIYDLRIENFSVTSKDPNNGCGIKGLKGSDLMVYRQETHLDAAYELLRDAVQCDQEKASSTVISYYYMSLFEKTKKAEGETQDNLKSLMLTEYLSLQDYIDSNISKYKKAAEGASEKDVKKYGTYQSYYEKAKDNVDNIFITVATCEDMVPILKKNLEADPENVDLAEKALRLMNSKQCTDNDIFLKTAEMVHQNNPQNTSAFSLAIGYAKERDLNKAFEYAEQAVELCPDCPERETYLLKAGQIASALKKSSSAISYANKVLELNPNSGEAYLLKGDAVASTAKGCDDGKIAMRAVYIQAADFYLRAKSVDSSVASEANRKYSNAKGQFPSVQELFVVSLKAGDSFTIPCSGASVTLKTRD